MSWILFLEPFTECAHSVTIRTDTALDQDCVLKATVQVCTACMIVPLLTTCMNLFQHSTLRASCTFLMQKFESQTRKYHPTKKLRKHVCQLILVCTTQRYRSCTYRVCRLGTRSIIGIHGRRTPILQFEQHCGTEANDWLCCNMCAILLLHDTEVFVSNLFLYSKVSKIFCVPFAFLLPIFPSQNSPFL